MQSRTTFTRHWKPSYCTFLGNSGRAAPLPVAEELLGDARQGVQLQLHLLLLLARLGELGAVEVGFDPRQQRRRDGVQTLVELAQHLEEGLPVHGRRQHDELLQLLVACL